ncbi:LOB domain-containing protein 33-like [Punica granatum]|uniref:LOB domain-containing protein 33-like n=1 Tax=Punica granatum TaxID=22663 RepID=A0A218WAY0_PUNGR|nr:LOB domain-containing protein 33-like [Punica granatum]OWM70034.1 hypothetical protein CDL15_Pgr025883 [Punica granatum]
MTGLGSSCGACKFLRRKCTSECVFAPYFCYDQAANHFAAVHKVFGASNVSKLLLHLPVQMRSDAAVTISYEALARIRDPIYGCVAHIFALQEQVANLQEEIEILGTQMANLGILSWGGSHVNNNNFVSNAGSHFPQTDPINLQFYQDQYDPVFPYAGNPPESRDLGEAVLTGNRIDNNNSEFPPLYGGEVLDQFCEDTDPSILERLFDGVDKEIFTLYPWLNNGTAPGK